MNKVSTKVEMRFVVSEAEWLPHDVRLRLARQEKGRMNNKGELVVTAQEFRQEFSFSKAHTAVIVLHVVLDVKAAAACRKYLKRGQKLLGLFISSVA